MRRALVARFSVPWKIKGYELGDAKDNLRLWFNRGNSVLRSSSLISLLVNPVAFESFSGG